MQTVQQYDPATIAKLSTFMAKVENRLEVKHSSHSKDAFTMVINGLLLKKAIRTNLDSINHVIMENTVTIEMLAAQVRAVRNLQNKYFRIPKDNKEEK